MADISKIKLNKTSYNLKDTSARDRLTTLETTVSSALVFKGTVGSATGITGLTNYKKGWTYKATTAFTISNVGTVENGDMIICVADYSSSYKAADWTVIQNNVDLMTGATTSKAGTRGLVPAPAQGSADRYLRSDGQWMVPPDTTYSAFTEKIGSATSGGTIAVDDITSWSAGSAPTATVSDMTLTFTMGSAPNLAYTARSIPNISITQKDVVVSVQATTS